MNFPPYLVFLYMRKEQKTSIEARCEPSNVFYFQDVGFLLNRES